jgi:hypothetical protein
MYLILIANEINTKTTSTADVGLCCDEFVEHFGFVTGIRKCRIAPAIQHNQLGT